MKELRKSRHLTQEQLAEKINRTVDTVSNIERGFSSTRITTAQEIAHILGVELSELFISGQGGDNGMNKLHAELDRLVSEFGTETVELALQSINGVLESARQR